VRRWPSAANEAKTHDRAMVKRRKLIFMSSIGLPVCIDEPQVALAAAEGGRQQALAIVSRFDCEGLDSSTPRRSNRDVTFK
jgi:hypothetical protein